LFTKTPPRDRHIHHVGAGSISGLRADTSDRGGHNLTMLRGLNRKRPHHPRGGTPQDVEVSSRPLAFGADNFIYWQRGEASLMDFWKLNAGEKLRPHHPLRVSCRTTAGHNTRTPLAYLSSDYRNRTLTSDVLMSGFSATELEVPVRGVIIFACRRSHCRTGLAGQLSRTGVRQFVGRGKRRDARTVS